ncbi:hypothetical protein SLEP1_g50994 [Rubroshorea leprosula]|uniref:Calcium-transporting ATPase n=1 Tax=Rubroshorea leprosula TaxID=152421 RepID=A0AAV5M2P7_9ROSI|nr:hypothetical protein SLEP1_g50994 [Rubroshorea leprosula]
MHRENRTAKSICIHHLLNFRDSHVSITIPQENNGSRINQTILTDLVTKKDVQTLQALGGVDGVAYCLETNLEGGINGSAEDITRRQAAFGSNTYGKKQPVKSFSYFVEKAFKDHTIMILLGCAALSLGICIKDQGSTFKESWYTCASISLAVFVLVAFSAIGNWWQDRQLDKLFRVGNNIQIDVIRGCQRQQISIFDVVVGDIVYLKMGDKVPADGLFLDGHSLPVDKSSMAEDRNHNEVNLRQNPFLVSSAKVINGFARMLVTSVGTNTAYGQMIYQTNLISSHKKEKTPLQTRVRKLARSIRKNTDLVIVVLVVVSYFTSNTGDEDGIKEFYGSKTKANDPLNAIKGIAAGAAIIIGTASLESLLIGVKLTLTYAMRRMLVDKLVVRKPSACEAMCSITTICTNKTGTLTLNQMKVKNFWLGRKPLDEVVACSSSSISPHVVDLILQGVALNTVEGACKGSSRLVGFEFFGSSTDKALLSWAALELKMDMKKLKQNYSILLVETFNSHKKRSGVLIKDKDDNTDALHVHWKGATEMILSMCSSSYDASGIMKDLNGEERMKFEQMIDEMAASGLRCVAFAHKRVSLEEGEDLREKRKLEEENLTLLGLAVIEDPCRPEVKEAMEHCRCAGMKIKMITGDNVSTARAIAIKCGILRSGDEDNEGVVVEGEVFRNYTLKERMEKVDNICVLARSSPLDRLLMVQCLKLKGQVVAVSSKNDSLALKEAHVGLSLGIQGTEVSKESSDIIILDDNFATIAVALKWGRCICWVNLIIGVLGALALATEHPTSELMEKPSVGPMERLITNIMWRNLLAQALYQIGALLMLQCRGEPTFGVTEAMDNILIFHTFVLCQVFNVFNARKLEKKNVFKDVYKNWKFLGIVGIMILLQVVMVEFLRQFANTEKLNREEFGPTEKLNWVNWRTCVAIAAVSWPVSTIVKCIPVPQLR